MRWEEKGLWKGGVSHPPSRVRPHWSQLGAERWSLNHSRPMIVGISQCRSLGPSLAILSPALSARPEEGRSRKSPRSLFVWTRLRPSSQWHFGQLVASLVRSWLSPFRTRRRCSRQGKSWKTQDKNLELGQFFRRRVIAARLWFRSGVAFGGIRNGGKKISGVIAQWWFEPTSRVCCSLADSSKHSLSWPIHSYHHLVS